MNKDQDNLQISFEKFKFFHQKKKTWKKNFFDKILKATEFLYKNFRTFFTKITREYFLRN